MEVEGLVDGRGENMDFVGDEEAAAQHISLGY
jgi:hypothetical protein